MSNKALSAALKRLWASEDDLPSSNFTEMQRKALNDFGQRTGGVCYIRKGRGGLYRIQKRDIVESHLRNLSPAIFNKNLLLKSNLPQRTMNIARARSSKSGSHQHEFTYVLLRAKAPALWRNRLGDSFDLYLSTQTVGVQALKIGCSSNDDWATQGTLWLVENQEVFDHLDWLPASSQPQSVLWYRGHLPNILLDWIAASKRATNIVLFADYDGVGLQNFCRLQQRLEVPVEFWLMPSWSKKLQSLGDNSLWTASHNEFKNAFLMVAELAPHQPELMKLCKQMQQLGLGLEQEAVFLL